ncbi:hypothetical protein ACFVWN_02190 [Nocardiopsis flavescens]|uniref:hypothetical protein n=1 Tax=Nocardiopsis flavescens TaxID=758803 RepID=UPI00365C963A
MTYSVRQQIRGNRFAVRDGALPRNIRMAPDGTLWGEVQVVPIRESLSVVVHEYSHDETPARNSGSARRPRPRRRLAGAAPEDVPGYRFKPDPLEAKTVEEFVEAMRRYRHWAGKPSYREMARRIGAGSAAGFCEALNRTDRLPSYALLNAFVVSLGGTQEDFQRWATAWRSLDGRVAGGPYMIALPARGEDTRA